MATNKFTAATKKAKKMYRANPGKFDHKFSNAVKAAYGKKTTTRKPARKKAASKKRSRKVGAITHAVPFQYRSTVPSVGKSRSAKVGSIASKKSALVAALEQGIAADYIRAFKAKKKTQRKKYNRAIAERKSMIRRLSK